MFFRQRERPLPGGKALPSRWLLPESETALVASTGIVLAFLLALLRTRYLVRWGDLHLDAPLTFVRELTVALAGDLTYVGLLVVLSVAGYLLLPKRSTPSPIIGKLLLTAAVISLLLAIVNIRAVASLGRPISWQWLYYSQFLNSLDARNALAAQLSIGLALQVLLGSLLLVCASLLLARGFRWILSKVDRRRLGIVGLVLGITYLSLAMQWLPATTLRTTMMENPVLAFARSIVVARRQPPLFTMRTAAGPGDFETAGQNPAAVSPTEAGFAARARSAHVRNVILYVMETVSAGSVGAFGAPYGATPEIDRQREQALRFTNIYAHVPATIHSLVGLLLSDYPPLSYRVLSKEHPRISLASLSGELKRHGYRTAFFNVADSRFQGEDVFLSDRGFDVLADFRSLPCSLGLFVADRPAIGEPWLSTSTHDQCAVDGLVDWLDKSTDDRPFFAMVWTAQTHYPYFPSEAPRRFEVSDTLFNRYLNALKDSDRAFGQLMSLLSQRHLLDSTLIIVVGDHGTTFNRVQVAPMRQLAEENVHVPLMLINPRLFHGEADSVVGGMIDVAPTILGMLGHPLPPTWQGRSLFADDRTGRAYLFSPFAQTMEYGFREGQYKFIVNAAGLEPRVFDLFADPRELHNIAASMPRAVTGARARLAAWIQFQDGFYRAHLAGSDP